MRNIVEKKHDIISSEDGNSPNRGLHLKFDMNGKSFFYTYIRKNGCSSFKKFLYAQSNCENQKRQYKSTLKYLIAHHSVSSEYVNNFDHSIFVVRDPMERIVSVFKNKFIQRSGNADIFKHYSNTSGKDPAEASFSNFIDDYLEMPFECLDIHVRPQFYDLAPMPYSNPIILDNLFSEMQFLIGKEAANQFFRIKVNNTSSSKSAAIVSPWDVPASKLHCLWLDTKMMPTTKDFLSESIKEKLNDLYKKDDELFNSVCNKQTCPYS